MEIFPKLIEYIHKAEKAGMTEQEIIDKLLSVGHSHEIIHHHIKHYHNKKRKSKMTSLGIAVLVVVFGFVLFLINSDNGSIKLQLNNTNNLTNNISLETPLKIHNILNNEEIISNKLYTKENLVKGELFFRYKTNCSSNLILEFDKKIYNESLLQSGIVIKNFSGGKLQFKVNSKCNIYVYEFYVGSLT